MRVKDNYVMRKIADEAFVIPIGEATMGSAKMLILNETSEILWKKLECQTSKADLIDAIVTVYEVTYKEAEEDIEAFLITLRELGVLQE